MDRCESTARLLDCDELDLVSYAGESEEYSSGYDSATESSDVDSENEAVEKRAVKDDVGDVKRYRSTHTLCNDLKYILSMPELCDIKFLVGDKKIPVYGIKAVLATRSKVFYSLILKTQRQKELTTASAKDKKKVAKQTTTNSHHMVIDVKKYKPEDFRRIVQFVHCGTIDISVDNVVGLYCGASQFGLSDLKIACWDFLQFTLKKTPALMSVLESKIRVYDQHKSSQRLLSKITDYALSIAEENESSKVGKETAI